jgi:signal transduction histidine kinase
MTKWFEPGPPAAAGEMTDEDLERLTWSEVSETARMIARLRVISLPFMMLIVGALVFANAEPWRLWVFGCTAVVVAGIVLRDYRWMRKSPLERWHVPYVLGSVLLLHTAMIVVTGGVESPFLVLYVVMGIVPAVTIGRFKQLALMSAVPLTLLWALTVGSALGWVPDISTSLWGEDLGFAANEAYVLIQAGIFTVATFIAGVVLLFMRRAVEQTVRSAVYAREDLVESVKERNRELMGLSGELAHELKNPLSSIRGLSDIVCRKLSEGTREKERMDVVVTEARRMEEILDQLLNFSRPVTGLSLREVSPREILADAVMVHEPIAHKKGVSLTGDPHHAPRVRCDPRKVKQALFNLVHNALEASKRGGEVALRCRAWLDEAGKEKGAELVAEDSGPGIADEIAHRIFEPGVTTKEHGAGLGLTIARAIARQHGGEVLLDNRAEGGCLSLLRLPLDSAPKGEM